MNLEDQLRLAKLLDDLEAQRASLARTVKQAQIEHDETMLTSRVAEILAADYGLVPVGDYRLQVKAITYDEALYRITLHLPGGRVTTEFSGGLNYLKTDRLTRLYWDARPNNWDPQPFKTLADAILHVMRVAQTGVYAPSPTTA